MMDRKSHTPGPWDAVKDGSLLADDWVIHTSHPDADARDVMEIWNAGEADAHLIAAAPCLLEGARWALECFGDNLTAEQEHALGKLKAAVGRATGERIR